MVYIGLDCSSTCTGYAVFADEILIDYGCIKPTGSNWRDRVKNQALKLDKLLGRYAPNKVFVEDVPLHNKGGLNTLVILGAVQGTVISLCAARNIEVDFVMPNEWRSEAGLFDGTKDGSKRDAMKEKAVRMANAMFGIILRWNGASSKYSEHDTAEAILICASQLGLIQKKVMFKKK